MKKRAAAVTAAIKKRDEQRNNLLEKSQALIDSHKTASAQLIKKWMLTQRNQMRSRQRELQYELAMTKKKELVEANQTARSKVQTIKSIDEFENKFRAIDQSDEGDELRPNPEKRDEFLARLESTAVKALADSTSDDYYAELRQKHKEKRLQRKLNHSKDLLKAKYYPQSLSYESKASNSPNKRRLSTCPPVTNESDSDEELTADPVKIAEYNKSMQEILAVAEKKLETFSAEITHREAETGERRNQLERVNQAQAARKKQKHDIAVEVCVDLVNELVNLACHSTQSHGVNESAAKNSSQPVNIAGEFHHNAGNLSQQIQDIIQSKGDGNLLIDDLLASEFWPPFAALGRNAGRWASNENNSVEYQPSTIQSYQQMLGHILSKVLPIDSDEASDLSRFESLTVTDNERTQINEFTSEKPLPAVFVIQRKGPQDFIELNAVLRTVNNWFGGGILTWDIMRSIELGLRLKKASDDPNFQFTFMNLLQEFGEMSWFKDIQEVDVTSMTLSNQANRVISDIIDLTTRIQSTGSVLTAAAKKKNVVMSQILPFSSTSIALLLSETLWLRFYLIESLGPLSGFQRDQIEKCVLILSQPIFKYNSCDVMFGDDPLFVKIIDWFLCGNRRDNIRKTDVDLLQAIETESQLSKNNTKKAAKSKAVSDEKIFETTLISNVIVLSKQMTRSVEAIDPISFITQDKDGLSPHEATVNLIEKTLIYFYSFSSSESPKNSPMKGKDQKSPSTIEIDSFSNCTVLIQMTRDHSELETSLNSIKATNLIILAEIMLSIVFLGTGLAAPSDKPDDDAADGQNASDTAKDELDYANRITQLRDCRRNGIPQADRVALLHLNQSRVINLSKATKVLNSIENVLARSSQDIGLRLMSLMLNIKSVESSIMSKKDSLVRKGALSDQEVHNICLYFQSAVLPFSAQSIAILSEDLVCQMGDYIDQSHMSHLNSFDEFTGIISVDVDRSIVNTIDHLDLFGDALVNYIPTEYAIGRDICEIFIEAGYAPNLAIIPSLQSKALDRMNITRKQDELRSLLIELKSSNDPNAILITPKQWERVLAYESDKSLPEMTSTTLTAIYLDILDKGCALITSMIEAKRVIEKIKRDSLKTVSDIFRKQHHYAHGQLRQWIQTLRKLMISENVQDIRKYLAKNKLSLSETVVQSPKGSHQVSLQEIYLISSDIYSRLHQQIVSIIDGADVTSSKTSIGDITMSLFEASTQKLEATNLSMGSLVQAVRMHSSSSVEIPFLRPPSLDLSDDDSSLATDSIISEGSTHSVEQIASPRTGKASAGDASVSSKVSQPREDLAAKKAERRLQQRMVYDEELIRYNETRKMLIIEMKLKVYSICRQILLSFMEEVKGLSIPLSFILKLVDSLMHTRGQSKWAISKSSSCTIDSYLRMALGSPDLVNEWASVYGNTDDMKTILQIYAFNSLALTDGSDVNSISILSLIMALSRPKELSVPSIEQSVLRRNRGFVSNDQSSTMSRDTLLPSYLRFDWSRWLLVTSKIDQPSQYPSHELFYSEDLPSHEAAGGSSVSLEQLKYLQILLHEDGDVSQLEVAIPKHVKLLTLSEAPTNSSAQDTVESTSMNPDQSGVTATSSDESIDNGQSDSLKERKVVAEIYQTASIAEIISHSCQCGI